MNDQHFVDPPESLPPAKAGDEGNPPTGSDSESQAASGAPPKAAAKRFADLGLDPRLLKTIEAMGFDEPSPIQVRSIPVAVEGKDMVGIAQTGSGKTAAFGLPLLQSIDPAEYRPQALVVCPTRELAVQVERAIGGFARNMSFVKTATLYGGTAYDRQIRDLKGGAQIVVGTPGRIMDHLKRGIFDPSGIRYIVLDEADRMLDMGFRDDMETLLGQMPADRQTLFFSATMNPPVKRLIQNFSNNPEWIEVKSETRSADTVEQGCYEVRWQSKPEVLFRMLELDPPGQAIIFCNTKRVVDECTEVLLSNGFPVDRLHGDMTQPMRERVLKKFRSGQISLLVATDVAGRGLDIEGVELVINYDLPRDPEDYVHRIGRTGRAGRAGKAVSLVAQREGRLLKMVERYAGSRIPRLDIPGKKELQANRAEGFIASVREQIEAEQKQGGSVGSEALEALVSEDGSYEAVAKALFTLWAGASSREIESIFEDGDRPRKRRDRDDREDVERQPRERRTRAEGDRGDHRKDGRQPREQRDGRDGRGERGEERWDRRDQEKGRKDRREDGNPPVQSGKRRVFIGLGKLENVRPGELAGMLYNEAGAPDGVIGKIYLFNKHTLVDIDEEWAEQIVRGARKARYRGRPFRIRFDEWENGREGS